MVDLIQLIAERLSRQLFWSWAALRRLMRAKRKRQVPIRQRCGRSDLLRYLGVIGVREGALVMAHTGVGGVEIRDEGHAGPSNALVQAQTIIVGLLDSIGPGGTLVMPTHAAYQTEEAGAEEAGAEEAGAEQSEIDARQERIVTYDPRRTPCGVGLANELFWRRKGVKRSLFPFNMLAAHGPLADELLAGNLNERHPSPHGADSGYYRFCQKNGLVISIGVPLWNCLTMAHVVEEVRTDWPIGNFFKERRYRVVENGEAREWTVRLRRDEFAQFAYCRKKMGRDLRAAGVIHEGHVGTLRVDWARAGEVFNFFWRKTAKRPYPYFGLWMMSKP